MSLYFSWSVHKNRSFPFSVTVISGVQIIEKCMSYVGTLRFETLNIILKYPIIMLPNFINRKLTVSDKCNCIVTGYCIRGLLKFHVSA